MRRWALCGLVVGVLSGCVGSQQALWRDAARLGQVAVFTGDDMQTIRAVTRQQLACRPDQTAWGAFVKSETDKLTLYVHCEER